MNKEEIVEAIKSMSVLEVSELVKELEDVFGVSAAAPVAVAAAPVAASEGADAGGADEEKTDFKVTLQEIGDKKTIVMKGVRPDAYIRRNARIYKTPVETTRFPMSQNAAHQLNRVNIVACSSRHLVGYANNRNFSRPPDNNSSWSFLWWFFGIHHWDFMGGFFYGPKLFVKQGKGCARFKISYHRYSGIIRPVECVVKLPEPLGGNVFNVRPPPDSRMMIWMRLVSCCPEVFVQSLPRIVFAPLKLVFHNGHF